jgi:REP element-mobilizing transposase RayT
MSRLRRLVLSDRYFFGTCNLRRSRRALGEHDFGRLASSLARMRDKHGFALTAWGLLPDPGHALLYPRHPLAISAWPKALKVSSMIAINRGRREAGELWQGRFFDHALRTVKDYLETVEQGSADLLPKVRDFSRPHAQEPQTSEKRGLRYLVKLSRSNKLTGRDLSCLFKIEHFDLPPKTGPMKMCVLLRLTRPKYFASQILVSRSAYMQLLGENE